jgi:hypothetical protein
MTWMSPQIRVALNLGLKVGTFDMLLKTHHREASTLKICLFYLVARARFREELGVSP